MSHNSIRWLHKLSAGPITSPRRNNHPPGGGHPKKIRKLSEESHSAENESLNPTAYLNIFTRLMSKLYPIALLYETYPKQKSRRQPIRIEHRKP